MKNNRAKPGLGFALATLLFLAACASKSPAPVSGGSQASSVIAAPVARDSYTVKSGDTLYSIAREHGMDYRELIAINGIDSPNRIVPGKVLKVRPQGAVGAASSAVASTAPVSSEVVIARPIGAEAGSEQRPLASNTDTQKREPKAGKEAYSEQALAKAKGQAKTGEPLVVAARTEAKPAEPALSGDELVWGWPANGKTIGTYSEGGNKGIDIAGKAGDPVLAAGDGKVIIANFLRGYGKLVIVKHNNTYVSVYGHNQTILVKEGQMVVKGQKIAEMGNTDTDQVKLHFEVRSQGKPLDPLTYLPQR
jgi:lipoprotein NlpD